MSRSGATTLGSGGGQREVHQHHLRRRLGLEGQAPGEELEEDDAARVEIAPR